jgi:hypothetical protein
MKNGQRLMSGGNARRAPSALASAATSASSSVPASVHGRKRQIRIAAASRRSTSPGFR